MNAHTPGPWFVSEYPWGGAVPDGHRWDIWNKSVMAGDWSVCMVQGDNGKPMEANARLIAAAPDLFEVLKEVLENVKARKGTEGEGKLSPRDITRMKLVLAKAEGRA